MLKVIFICDSCEVTCEGNRPIRRRYVTVSNSNDFLYTDFRDVLPKDWTVFDSNNGQTLCPECKKLLEINK